jgi:t-SNARE complex subunit (syntaxin)
MKLLQISILVFIVAAGLSGCGKKNFEDTDAYKELIKRQEETDRKIDSIRRENFRQLSDTVNSSFKKQLDSLKKSTDSLEKELEKSIEQLKKTNK